MRIDFQALFDSSPNLYMVLDRDLCFVAANRAYLTTVATRFEELVGRHVFDVFPHDPDDPHNPNQRLLRESFERVLATGKRDTVALIVYRVPVDTPEGKSVRESQWSASHTPIFDDAGAVSHILQHTVDVSVATNYNTSEAAHTTSTVHAGLLQRVNDVQESNVLLASERRHLRNMFEQAPGFAAFLRGRDHVFDLANPAYHQLVGHRDILGRPVREALPEIASQGYLELLDEVFSSGRPFVGRGLTARLQRTPGAPLDEVLIDLVYQPIVDHDGRVAGIFVQGHDITDQRKLERERERLATIVEQSSDWIGVANGEGIVTFLNEAGQKMLGLSPDRIGKVQGSEFFMPEDLKYLTTTIYPTLMQEGRWEGPFRYRHFETGEAIPIHYNLFTIKHPGDRAVTTFASVSRDLRAALAQEDALVALSASERAARLVTEATQAEHAFLDDAIPVQVWTAMPNGRLSHVNQRVVTYFGRDYDQILGEGWQNVVHPDDLPHTMSAWMNSIETGEPYECEFRLLRASDNTYRWHIARALCLRDDDGWIIKWFGTNTDIDDLKRTEHERDSLIMALSASNFELDQFAYVASHDLKAPLRGIANLAQWIEDDIGDTVAAETREHLTMMRRRVARMDALVDGVLNYSRAGRSKVGMEDIHVGSMLAEILELLAPAPEVTVVVAPNMPRVRTVAIALQQVFMNLIGNAFKHARRNDPVVHIDAHDVSGARPMVRFSVKDNGPGIDGQFHDRIWALFQVLQPRDEVEGSGIGLAVVKKLVEGRGGQVGVESRPGEGATFWFTWPRVSG